MTDVGEEPVSDRAEEPEADRPTPLEHENNERIGRGEEPITAAQAASRALERQPESGTSITRRMRGLYSSGQADLIFATVAKDLEQPGERAMFLEICARHELDPFVKEIWAYKKKGRVVIQVARDGLLGIANRHTPEGKLHVHGNGQFLGCPSNVVYEHDYFDFRYEERADGTEKVVVDHRPRDAEGRAVFGDTSDPSKQRGKMVGSWARCRRLGHDDTFFQAFASQYAKSTGGPVWESHPHAMMQKCAESVVLRKAFSVSGVVGEGEIVPPSRENVTATDGGGSPDIVWPEDEELREALQQRVTALGYRRAKVRMIVNACGDEEAYRALLVRLDGELDQADAGDAGDPGPEGAPIEDAVVVGDAEPGA